MEYDPHHFVALDSEEKLPSKIYKTVFKGKWRIADLSNYKKT
jgi:hypothetical protein